MTKAMDAAREISKAQQEYDRGSFPLKDHLVAAIISKHFPEADSAVGKAEAKAGHLGDERTPQDYAIEHGGYLADAAEHYLDERNKFDVLEAVDIGDQDSLNDHIRALRNCTFEFRRRAKAALASRRSEAASSTQPPTDKERT